MGAKGTWPRRKQCPKCGGEKCRVILCSSCYGLELDELERLRSRVAELETERDAAADLLRRFTSVFAPSGRLHRDAQAWLERAALRGEPEGGND